MLWVRSYLAIISLFMGNGGLTFNVLPKLFTHSRFVKLLKGLHNVLIGYTSYMNIFLQRSHKRRANCRFVTLDSKYKPSALK